MPGKYLLFRARHFTSLEIRADGTNIWRTTCRRHIGFAAVHVPLLLNAMDAVYQLGDSDSTEGNPERDVLGGAQDVCVLRKEPHVWLRMRHNQTRSLQRSDDAAQEEGERIPSVEGLQAKGMTREQARQHIVSITQALRRWNTATPPMLTQTFGIASRPCSRGIRIPWIPEGTAIQELPACENDYTGVEPQFTWLQQCHPHDRDHAVRFEAAGHKYFLNGVEADTSVTSLIGRYAHVSQLHKACVRPSLSLVLSLICCCATTYDVLGVHSGRRDQIDDIKLEVATSRVSQESG